NKDITFVCVESNNLPIVEFGRVNGYAAIDIPRIGTYSGICVDVPDTTLKTITDAEGYFLLKRIPPGRINIRANGSGLTPDMWRDIEVIGQQQMTAPGTLTLINGDASGDGMVNTNDFGWLRDAYFKTKKDAGWIDTGTLTRNGYINADFNGDDKVSTEDFAILRDNYFKAVGASRQFAPSLVQSVQPLILSTSGVIPASTSAAHLVIVLPRDMDKLKVNKEFPVIIRVENVAALTNMDFCLGFDPNVLTVNRTQGYDFLPKIASDIKNSAGFVNHAAGLMSGTANGYGTIATVYFSLRKRQNTRLEFIRDASKNGTTMLMSAGRRNIPFTSEPASLLFDGTNIGKIVSATVSTTATTAVTNATEAKTMPVTAISTTIATDAAAVKAGTVSMTQVASLKPDGMSYGIFLQGNYAYMSCESGGVQIIDVTNPASPTLTGKYKTTSTCRDTYVVGNYAYVASGVGGMVILDVSNVSSPVLVSKIAIDGFCHDVAVSGNYAYLAAAQGGLQVIDISKPQTPKKLGKYTTTGIVRGVCVRDSYAFVANGSYGLTIIDVSNPYGPRLVSSCDTSVDAYDIWLNEKYAYIADYSGGLVIVDISNLTKPIKVGSYKTGGYAWDVTVKDNLAFVVCEAAGLSLVNIADPYHPALVGKLDIGGKAFGVSVAGEYAFVADDYQGLKVIRVEGIGQKTEDKPQIIADRPQTTDHKPQPTEGVDAKTTASDGRVKIDDRDRGGSTQTISEAGSGTTGNRPGTGSADHKPQTAENVDAKTTASDSRVKMDDIDRGGSTQITGEAGSADGKPQTAEGVDAINGRMKMD
ncbi:MAG: hypothetical protein AAB296_04995, partial [Candidatus Desantisbacteria bacterium]